MQRLRLQLFIIAILTAACIAGAQETTRIYLSGHGKDDAVQWKFLCTTGAQSGFWTNIPVPSNWELQGFGHLNYKKDSTNALTERGLYERDYFAPVEWAGKRIFLVFDGVMTDASAKINGQSAGPTHQGGYYRFKYEITPLVKIGATNNLEVDVAKHSENKSINKAERLADFWVFGGIYRPVWLEVVPNNFIERVAIDARADGSFSAQVFLNGLTNASEVEAQIQTPDGQAVGDAFTAGILHGGARPDVANLKSQIPSPKLWTAETPNLYNAIFRLKQNGRVVHEISQRFGFRTFEVRDGDGLYLNGEKIILRGINRHSFWPESGRALSEAVHRLDIATIKDMNANAVRMCHYPPDEQFLDLCDELGLYVLDELTGWHNFYDNDIGPKLVKEMVVRDVNHPSILFWDNGNEGGFNTNLDKIFPQLDPQQRRVLHPWASFNGLCTAHYLAFDKAEIAAGGKSVYFKAPDKEVVATNDHTKYIYMPTEFQHGLFDGGAGAGMADYWRMMMGHTNCAGGFIWTFTDDAVKHPDTGAMDTAGNQAPDGVVGPYRQREGSFHAIRQIWSPVEILETNLPQNFDGTLTLENHFAFTDASRCKFTWQLRRLDSPLQTNEPNKTVSAEGVADSPAIAPGKSGNLKLNLPENFSQATEGGLLAVRAEDPSGREIRTWVWPLRERKVLPGDARVVARADKFAPWRSSVKILRTTNFTARIDGVSGRLLGAERDGKTFPLVNGPRLAAQHGRLKNIAWQLRDDGWLQCDFTCRAEGTNDFLGVVFDCPENLVKSKRWLGDGPYRVWKNRPQGGTLGVWQNDYNNTITGWRGWIYPEFKGCFSNVRWLQLETTVGKITVVPEKIPFVQVLTPEFPPTNLVGKAIAPLPKCGLGFLHAIPPIGSKFKPAAALGPSGQPNVAHGDYSGRIFFHFGE